MNEIEVPVLIAGGSLVGLTTSMLLAHHGVRSLTVEYHRGTAIHPRAAQMTQRSMEILRGLGIEKIVRDRSAEQFVQDGGVIGVETLAGGVMTAWIANLNEGIRDVSPCERVFLSQNSLEPILKERALELGASLQFSTQVVSVEQDAEGVTAELRHRDTGEVTRVRARYLVAADGAHSRLREGIGVRMQGHPSFSRSITIYFRANLRPYLEGKIVAVVYVNNDRLRGFFRFEKPFDSGFLVVNTHGDPANPDSDCSSQLDDARAQEFLHAALGADIPVEVDNVMRWNATAEYVERMRVGRVFIAGDAAHTMPPNGGWGGNTGIQDAQNLAWKLAYVLSGRAGPGLLDTYDAERRLVGALATEQAYSRYVARTAPYLGMAGAQSLVSDLNVELGYVYRSPAIVSEDQDEGAVHMNPREMRGRPGTRAPHVWMRRQADRVSTLDLPGKEFKLLAGPKAQRWCAYAEQAAERTGVELAVHRIGAGGIEDPDRAFCGAYGIEESGCVIVRPDDFVGWRARTDASASAEELGLALNRILARSAADAGAPRA
ncbi:MAG TPA: FAD-dependent monooxygenase [Steroidobacteraceae bacterium]